MMTPNTLISQSAGILASEIDGEVVILNVQDGCYVCLDAIGSRIWRQLQTETGFGRLCSVLEQEFVGESDTIRSDVEHFVETLAASSLVSIRHG